MDEKTALKYIFKDFQILDTNAINITFNGNTYTFSSDMEGYKSAYDYVLQKESNSESKKNEISKEIDSSYTEIQKITEAQFLEWQKAHKRQNKTSEITGATIWKMQKSEDVYD